MNCWSAAVLLAAVAFVLAEAAEAKREFFVEGGWCLWGQKGDF